MWESHTELSYQVNNPALSTEKYLYFALYYVGVPWNEAYIRRVTEPKEIAVSTTGSSHFEPDSEHCMGAHPQVCRPLKECLHDTCAVELIAQRDKPNCLVEVSARGNQTMEMFHLHIHSDEVVLSSYESTALTFRCPGETPRQQRVRGPTKVTIPKSCGVEAAEWALSGIDRGQSAVHLPTTKYQEIPCMNITWPEAPMPWSWDS